MKINFKKLSDTAIAPNKSHYNDSGFDLYADGHVEVVDVKGFMKNPVFLIKQKLFMFRYQIPLVIVKWDAKTKTFVEV